MKRFINLSNLRLAIEVLLIIVLLQAILTKNNSTQAASSDSVAAPDATYWYACNATNHVGLFLDRVHIYCTTTSPIAGAPALDAAIHWFTLPTSTDSAAASRFMSLFQTSVITSRVIWLYVDPNDTSGTNFGCSAVDCRRIYGMEMR